MTKVINCMGKKKKKNLHVHLHMHMRVRSAKGSQHEPLHLHTHTRFEHLEGAPPPNASQSSGKVSDVNEILELLPIPQIGYPHLHQERLLLEELVYNF